MHDGLTRGFHPILAVAQNRRGFGAAGQDPWSTSILAAEIGSAITGYGTRHAVDL